MNYPYYQQSNYSQPNYYQQPTYYQPTYPVATQARIESAWVQGGEAGAKSYALAPNVTAFLMDSDDDVLYIKSADSSGRMTMKSYDLVERTNDTPKPTDKVKYVKAEDFESLQSRFEKLESRFYNYKNKGNNNEKKEVTDNG